MADKLLELEAKLSNVVNDNLRLRKRLKEAIKETGVFNALLDEMRLAVKPFDALPTEPIRAKGKNTIQEHLVMHFSDSHVDEVIEPQKVGNLEDYNFNVACCRAEKYIDTVIKFSQQTLSNYRFPVLWILAYGDHISGCLHMNESRSHYRNVFKNSLAAGQMHSLMLRDLAPYFKRINYVGLSGNHGRTTKKKDYDGAQNNYDYLIHNITKLYCKGIKNIDFLIPDSYSINLNINGYGFNISHGDDIKSWSGIPYYGIERRTRRLAALHQATGLDVKYFVNGHFHALSTMSELKGETIINGAWTATSPYSYESFCGYRDPSQLIHGVHNQQGISWRMNVKLKDSKAEKLGPQRYKIDID